MFIVDLVKKAKDYVTGLLEKGGRNAAYGVLLIVLLIVAVVLLLRIIWWCLKACVSEFPSLGFGGDTTVMKALALSAVPGISGRATDHNNCHCPIETVRACSTELEGLLKRGDARLMDRVIDGVKQSIDRVGDTSTIFSDSWTRNCEYHLPLTDPFKDKMFTTLALTLHDSNGPSKTKITQLDINSVSEARVTEEVMDVLGVDQNSLKTVKIDLPDIIAINAYGPGLSMANSFTLMDKKYSLFSGVARLLINNSFAYNCWFCNEGGRWRRSVRDKMSEVYQDSLSGLVVTYAIYCSNDSLPSGNRY